MPVSARFLPLAVVARELARCLLTATILLPLATHAETIDVDVQKQYGLTLEGIETAIADARRHFATAPNDIIVEMLPAGTFDFSAQYDDSKRSDIDVSNVMPGPQGRLIFQGAGSERTTLIFANRKVEIAGRNTYRVSFVGMHLTVDAMTVSQGHVVSLNGSTLVLDIQPGFPSPGDLYNLDFSQTHHGTGRAVRRYTDSRDDPHLDTSRANRQFSWNDPRQIPGYPSRWQIELDLGFASAPYRPGDLIAIKAKKGAQAFAFLGGSDVMFKDILWTRTTRGIFRGGMDKVSIIDSSIRRDPPVNGQVPCLASAAGGPQIGFPADGPISGILVDHFYADAPGDNGLGFFNVTQGVVKNTTIIDAFTPPVLLFKSPNVVVDKNDHFVRGDVMNVDHLKFYR